VVQRDHDQPDLGYHYDSLDYVVSGVTVASNVSVLITNGAAVAVDYAQSSWGFILDSGRLTSEGAPFLTNRVTRAHLVQEQWSGNPGYRAMFYDNAGAYGGSPPRLATLRFRGTEFSEGAEDGYVLYTGTSVSDLEWTHCSIFNPSIVVDTAGSGALGCAVTNTLFVRGGVLIGLGTTGAVVTAHLRNNLWRGVSLNFYNGNTNNWTVRDNLFDTMYALTNNGSAIENSYNAYYQTAYGLTGGANNLALTNLAYETGPLGLFYQPTNSLLIDAGSRWATNAGFYHFTTVTNQTKEAATLVDIGLHYLALNGIASTSSALDTDSDTFADYFEDLNGDGVVDATEMDWQIYNSRFGIGSGPGLITFTPLK
jgi:hypothetical protein